MVASVSSELAAPEDGRAPLSSILRPWQRRAFPDGRVGYDTMVERARLRAQQRESADKPWKTWSRPYRRSLLRPRTGALPYRLSCVLGSDEPFLMGGWDMTLWWSAPVSGRSNVKARISLGKHGRVRIVGACCARGRARSPIVYPASLAATSLS